VKEFEKKGEGGAVEEEGLVARQFKRGVQIDTLIMPQKELQGHLIVTKRVFSRGSSWGRPLRKARLCADLRKKNGSPSLFGPRQGGGKNALDKKI